MNCSAMTIQITDNDYDHNRVDNRKAQAGTNMTQRYDEQQCIHRTESGKTGGI